MKKLYLYLLLLCATGVSGQGNITLSTAQDKGGTQVACQSITLKPGFSFVSATGKSLTLSVNPTTCDPYAGQASSVSSNQNYIQTRTYTAADGSRYLDQIQYFDGLGRPMQTVQRSITPNTADLVTYQEYDAFGRESNSWLPAVIPGNNGAFVNPATVKTGAISSNGNDQKPYSLPVYEASPLNRVLKQFGPGQDWHNADNGNGKAVLTAYKTNVSGDAVLNCKLYTTGDTNQSPTLIQSGNYATGELYVTEVKDEDGNTSYEFKDKLGQVVLTRQINDGQNYDTYYVYNDFGLQCFVLPPKIQDEGVSQAKLDELAFQYRYDNRNRCIAKKIPGAEWNYYIYDKADRLILSQDGEQRKKDEWQLTLPDAFGRIVLTGMYLDNISQNNYWEHFQDKVVTGVYVNNYWGGYAFRINGTDYFPKEIKTYTVNYYDSYDFLARPEASDPNLKYKESGIDAVYLKRYGDDKPENKYKHKGLLTGTLTVLLDGREYDSSTSYVYSALYYDDRKQLIQSKSTNHLGGIEEEYIAYNFTGQPTKRKHIHSATGKTTQTEAYAYTYDHAGRLLKTTHQLNSGVVVTLAENTYDELGRLKTNKKNNQANLNTTYAYNIRSWTSDISSYHFNERLAYTYNGNISSMQWGQAGKWRTYDFTYDNLSRLKTAAYTGDGNFSTAYSYDKHGNMMTLQRYGLTDASTYGIIDNLTMTYTGNQMKTVSDAAADIALNTSMDFKEYTKGTEVEYFYNRNGAMYRDLNKGISQIAYNSLNLPRIVDIKNMNAEGRNEYTYSASGQKLRAVQKWNPNYSTAPVIGSDVNVSALTNSSTTDYVGNIIYENNALKRILVDGGYYENGNYYFYVNDHLGNNRVVTNAAASEVQSTQYYPFGNSFADAMGGSVQLYKYNGKELDARNGLNMSDYGARWKFDWYFTTTDPLAEKFYSWSPYVYTFNNPLRFTDPTGMGPEDGIFGDILKALKQVVNEVLHEVGLSGNQIQSDNPAVREDASQKRQEFTETMHTVNETMLSVVPGGDVAYKVANNREVTAGDMAWAVVGAVPAGKGAKGAGIVAKGANALDKAGDAAKVIGKSSTILKTATGVEITGFTKHGLNRAIERGVKPNAILDAVKNPLKIGNVSTDAAGRQSQRFIGQFGEVVINPQTGKIVSVNPTDSKKVVRLIKQLGQ